MSKTVTGRATDLFGGTTSGIVWRNSNGDTALWQLNGSGLSAAYSIGNVDTTWHLYDAAADFNGDGRSDLLWQGKGGSVVVWLMGGAVPAATGTVAGSVSSDWTLVSARGDYNGDGKSDLLWRSSSTGAVVIWFMNGATVVQTATLGNVDASWTILNGEGDYDGDGKSDLLWMNADRTVLIWEIGGSAIKAAGSLGVLPSGWVPVAGAGDHNGDSRADILWRNQSTGAVALWMMNGLNIQASASLGLVGIEWSIQDNRGDYNGDGRADILWRNHSGQNLFWTLNGGVVTSAVSLPSTGSEWSVASRQNANGNSSWTLNSFVPACSGAGCGAVGPNTYSGGVGVWSYSNASSASAGVDINIAGVTAGHKVTLLFSNGTASTAPTLPSAGSGTPPAALAAAAPDAEKLRQRDGRRRRDAAHTDLEERNRELSEMLIAARRDSSSTGNAAPTPAAAPAASPAVGASRVWYDNYFYPSARSHTATVTSVCTLPSGRNVVIWLDNATPTNVVTPANMSALQTASCGATGGVGRVTGLIGEPWGSGAATFSYLIQETAGALQDINIVVLYDTTAPYGGYFYALNNYKSTIYSTSNQALAVFLNASDFPVDENYSLSSMVHESTHMINYYQRTVVRNASRDTWLEETSAMMAEDIVSPLVANGLNVPLSIRVPDYLDSGGGFSLVDWTTLSYSSYGYGGALGAFLTRRYGLAIFKQLVTDCLPGAVSAPGTSYACVDDLIKQNGGAGLRDELARLGATVFGTMPSSGGPAGFGYPALTSDGYSLQALNLYGVYTAPAPAAMSSFTNTTHTYRVDVMPSGSTGYNRTGVVVPAGTDLIVVIE